MVALLNRVEVSAAVTALFVAVAVAGVLSYRLYIARHPTRRRAAFDIGSGATKLLVADVAGGLISARLLEENIPIAYKTDAQANGGHLSNEIQEQGLARCSAAGRGGARPRRGRGVRDRHRGVPHGAQRRRLPRADPREDGAGGADHRPGRRGGARARDRRGAGRGGRPSWDRAAAVPDHRARRERRQWRDAILHRAAGQP